MPEFITEMDGKQQFHHRLLQSSKGQRSIVCKLILFALSYMGFVESSKNNMEQIFGLSSLGYKFLCLVLTWNKFGIYLSVKTRTNCVLLTAMSLLIFFGNWLAFLLTICKFLSKDVLCKRTARKKLMYRM